MLTGRWASFNVELSGIDKIWIYKTSVFSFDIKKHE